MRSMKRTSCNHYSDNDKNLLVVSICVLSNVLRFFQLGKFNLGVNIRDCVQDQKSNAKSCFTGPLLQPSVRHNFMSSIPPTNAVLGEVPLLTF